MQARLFDLEELNCDIVYGCIYLTSHYTGKHHALLLTLFQFMYAHGSRLVEQIIKLLGQEPDQPLAQDVIGANPTPVLIQLLSHAVYFLKPSFFLCGGS